MHPFGIQALNGPQSATGSRTMAATPSHPWAARRWQSPSHSPAEANSDGSQRDQGQAKYLHGAQWSPADQPVDRNCDQWIDESQTANQSCRQLWIGSLHENERDARVERPNRDQPGPGLQGNRCCPVCEGREDECADESLTQDSDLGPLGIKPLGEQGRAGITH